MISKLAPIVRQGGNTKIPEVLEISRAQIERHWDYWPLWRLVDKNIPAFTAALSLPKGMLDTFYFLDDFLIRMTLEKEKNEKKFGVGDKR